MLKRHLMVFSGLLVVLGCSLPAQAERREDSAADAMHKAQIMIRRLSMQKSELQAESSQLSARVNELEDKVAGLESGLEKSRKKLGKAEKNNDRLVGRIRNDSDKYKQLLEKYRDVSQTLRSAMRDNNLLVNAVQERSQWTEQCRTQNEKMFKASLDLLDQYKNKTVAQVIKGKEPVLGLGRVELETAIQDYRFRLEDLTVTPYQPSTPMPSQASISQRTDSDR
ncbi:MAG TPA: hypothetical protein ENI68_10750 [Gammaproteobacteria bacterium]|nr:hypothetical protein [Gammaproteobacteria bacterium]